ncbi:3-hydroxyacyl-CoA dehydrogenase NAD-binding domain-containing protein [Arthrobacter sp. NPDC055138]
MGPVHFCSLFATNSSTLPPGNIAVATGRPEKFLALHFANEVRRMNTGEIMGHAGTAPQNIDAVGAFAEEIGIIPIRLKKEQPGYILNSLLVPFLTSAAKLYGRDVADVADIDATWRRATGGANGTCHRERVLRLRVTR